MKIGTDITVVSRIEKSINKFGDKFLDRFLSPSEQELSKRVESIAGYWAAKEAIAKALGCGICADLGFHDIIIYKDEKGAPHFRLTERARSIHKMKSSSLSIAHDGGFAIAIAIVTQIEH
ncbi:MAG: Holo-[acyl-carrier protein] synthase (EC [uncultured Sulfurovum sp.]|uniref:Holo-[acyl-carrier-protein] synthase n=1 Tax=uncultured Sulfurovum sp. TaxID=269237 RepID=A0A6S6SZ68_9BACT|nr:MAG: Holo-[acyl-carrier protein] synthase (EC [uncultured Sulfurovum sp.]